jgi:hypothetical protein
MRGPVVEPSRIHGKQCPLNRRSCTHEGRGRRLGVGKSKISMYGTITLGRWKRAGIGEGFELGEYKRIDREATTHMAC